MVGPSASQFGRSVGVVHRRQLEGVTGRYGDEGAQTGARLQQRRDSAGGRVVARERTA